MPNSFLLAHPFPSGTTSALPAGMKVHSRYRIIEHLNISGEELGGNCLKILGMDLLEYETSINPLSITFFQYYSTLICLISKPMILKWKQCSEVPRQLMDKPGCEGKHL